jgi:hypothetical protein
MKTKECKKCGNSFGGFRYASKFCLDCRASKTDKQRHCKCCDAPLPRTQGPKKYCKACAVKAVELRTQRESIESAVGKVCSVRFVECVECNSLYSASNGYRQKIDVCSSECRAKAYANAKVEGARWLQYPFQFRLSDSVVAVRSRIRRVVDKAQVGFCCFCGSAKVMGEAVQRSVSKGNRFFCDQECACEWKSIHYASANHKPMELQRQETRAKQQQRQEQARKRKEELEIARLIKPANAKTSGYYTCTVCNKTEWVESHANRKFCSRKCNAKSPKAKAIKKLSKQNRRHKTRSKSGVAQLICIDQLMKRDRRRCKQCKTLCVKPEGYNHPNEGTIDHIMPLSKGGLHLWSNVQLLCSQCNTAKRDVVLPGTQMMLRFAP